MTSFRIGSTELEKWLHQNRAEFTGDIVEGGLLDSFMVATKRGFAAIYEHYCNEWASDYTVEFERGDAREVWARWKRFKEQAKSA